MRNAMTVQGAVFDVILQISDNANSLSDIIPLLDVVILQLLLLIGKRFSGKSHVENKQHVKSFRYFLTLLCKKEYESYKFC